MLTKLISYELKSVARHFIPIYGLILAVSTILGLYFHTLPIVEWVGGIGGGLLFGLLIAILVSLYVALYVITIIMIIKRFNSNLLGDEGYLMMTLPVSVETILHSKWISSLIWFIASAIVSGLSFFLIISLSSDLGFSDFIDIVHEIPKVMNQVPVMTILLAFANIFFGFLFFLFLLRNAYGQEFTKPSVPEKTEKFYRYLLRENEKVVAFIESSLVANGIPKLMRNLALIESNFDKNAVSSAQAVGIWQFTVEHAQQYGLSSEGRYDVYKSTLAKP